jgi:hypothetical protein
MAFACLEIDKPTEIEGAKSSYLQIDIVFDNPREIS